MNYQRRYYGAMLGGWGQAIESRSEALAIGEETEPMGRVR